MLSWRRLPDDGGPPPGMHQASYDPLTCHVYVVQGRLGVQGAKRAPEAWFEADGRPRGHGLYGEPLMWRRGSVGGWEIEPVTEQRTRCSRLYATLTYHAEFRIHWLVGGADSWPPCVTASTWQYDPTPGTGRLWLAHSRWHEFLVGNMGACAGYHPDRQTLVVCGGRWKEDIRRRVVESNPQGVDWTERPPAPWGVREFAAMAWDPVLHALVMVGGLGHNGPIRDCWLYRDPSTIHHGWSLGPPLPQEMPTRYGHSMAWDGQRLVVFGGNDGNGPLGDTWMLGSNGWEPGPAGPTPRMFAAMTTAPGGGVLLVGGTSGFDVMNTDRTWRMAEGAVGS